MKNKRLLTSSGLLLTAIGVYYFLPKQEIPSLSVENNQVSFSADSFSGVSSFPKIGQTNVWSIHDKETLNFMTNDKTGNFELLISDLSDQETYYQIIVHKNDRQVKFYKYVGGVWSDSNVDGKSVVSRTNLMRVLWKDTEKIDITIGDDYIRINIPWETIPGISINDDDIVVQIISGSGDTMNWSSNNIRNSKYENQFDTNLHDRNKWKRLNLE